MTFRETPLCGAYVIEPVLLEDERGMFARTYCREEFIEHGLNPSVVQCNMSYNHRRGTLRGLHFQQHPRGEAKLVRCVRGAVYDVIVDLRPESSTFGQWFAAELSDSNHTMMYAPEGFAHGFQCLADQTELLYHMSRAYEPDAAAGVRWDDPSLAIRWPVQCPIMSLRDRTWPFLEEAARRTPAA